MPANSQAASREEKHSFQAEVDQLLHLVTHALYSNKEIFLRELISNASDAADKLRFAALADPRLYENSPELKIWLSFDSKTNTITIRDNGIGMSRDEVIANLGTIAQSGTREFLASLKPEQTKDSNLIGRFGVGFYSAFVVAKKVVVRTRRAGLPKEQGVYWESSGEHEYLLKDIAKEDRGTEIILYLKEDAKEFLDHWRLKNIITKYSDHIMLPIVMIKPDLGDTDEKKALENEPKEPEEETVNRATALWALPKSSITDEQYQEFYKHISHDFEDSLLWGHNKVEGKLEYTSLLYIPSHAPFDMWMRDKPRGLKLYVKRVFIMDDAEQLMPMYLRFVKGIVDSNDLPLNVSREILQNNKVVESIRNACTKRVLDMLENLAKEDGAKYSKFWQAFGNVLKEGPAEDFANRERIAKLLRFASTHNDNEQQTVSLDDYISRMQEGQDKIYYITAETFLAAKNSPHLEIFRKKGIEALLLYDRIDEWLVTQLHEFHGKTLVSVAKGDLDISKDEDKALETELKDIEQSFDNIIKHMQEILGDRVKAIRLTQRLTDSPACLVVDENEMSVHLQRLLKAAGQAAPTSKPIMELNPKHPLVTHLKVEQDDDRFTTWTQVLFEQALLAEGGHLEDPAGFVKRLNQLLLQLDLG